MAANTHTTASAWIDGRRHFGLDVLAPSRVTLTNAQNSEDVKDSMTSPALTA